MVLPSCPWSELSALFKWLIELWCKRQRDDIGMSSLLPLAFCRGLEPDDLSFPLSAPVAFLDEYAQALAADICYYLAFELQPIFETNFDGRHVDSDDFVEA